MRARAAVALAAATLGLSLAPTVASGAGETYVVAQCHTQNRAHEARLIDDNAYSARAGCADASREFSIQLNNIANAGNGRSATATWEVPSSVLGIVRVDVEGKLRRDSNHRSRLVMANASKGETHRVATGGTGPTGFDPFSWSGAPQAVFRGILVCQDANGCAQSDLAKTWVRNLKLTVADGADPQLTDFSGSLIEGGWLRGEQSLRARATDAGSGLRRVRATVDGAVLAERAGSCPYVVAGSVSVAERFVPCGAAVDFNQQALDSDADPFDDGANLLRVCAYDFAGNATCEERTVLIDNAPPSLAFANFQDPDDPELIRASISDPHSGVASGGLHFRQVGSSLWQPLETQRANGELRARIDSASLPPGDYEFMAEATDVAGNSAHTLRRENGEPMVLRLPLRDEVELSAKLEPSGAARQTIRYGRAAHVGGRLTSASGSPLRSQRLSIVEYFGDGALIRERVSHVSTDGEGRWALKLPAGPSRTVTAEFAGTRRYLPDAARAGQLRVRSKIRFRTSRKQVPEGGKIRFKGRIGRLGARIPAGGKLVELQVRERAGRWQTVREAFYTNDAGRYRLGYRFGTFYQADARFKFRAKLVREQGWPYKAPVSSAPRRVILQAR